jgi:hypothetical protein
LARGESGGVEEDVEGCFEEDLWVYTEDSQISLNSNLPEIIETSSPSSLGVFGSVGCEGRTTKITISDSSDNIVKEFTGIFGAQDYPRILVDFDFEFNEGIYSVKVESADGKGNFYVTDEEGNYGSTFWTGDFKVVNE